MLRLQEYNDEGGFRETPGGGGTHPARLRYSYYTAGSGGVGPTILETSMLLAGEEVIAYRDGQKASFPDPTVHPFVCKLSARHVEATLLYGVQKASFHGVQGVEGTLFRTASAGSLYWRWHTFVAI